MRGRESGWAGGGMTETSQNGSDTSTGTGTGTGFGTVSVHRTPPGGPTAE
ncbi:hypothetical protein GCM10027091_28240 [Streptomyces daliensis]